MAESLGRISIGSCGAENVVDELGVDEVRSGGSGQEPEVFFVRVSDYQNIVDPSSLLINKKNHLFWVERKMGKARLGGW